MTEDTSTKASPHVSPATDEFPTTGSADPFDAPQGSDKVPPPMTFAGRAGTGAINVEATASVPNAPCSTEMIDSTAAVEKAAEHDVPTTATALETPVVLEPLPIDSEAPTGLSSSTSTTVHTGTSGGVPHSTGSSPAQGASAPPAVPVSAGPAEHSFHLLSFVALFSLALILAVQQCTSIYIPSIFTPSEMGIAGVYEQMLASGQWLAPPHLANMPASLPVYFWFVHLVDTIPYADGNVLYPLVSACSAFVALAGVYTLGLTTGLGNKVAFAAGLLLLSCLGFTPLGHYLSPDLFFAGTLAFSMACLYRGWVSQQSYMWLALGFALAGISTLTGGLMGLVVPLLTSLGFVMWRGTFRRGHQLDAVFGFALLLVIIVGWLGAIILLTGESAYLYTLSRQLFAPLIGPLWPPQDPWWLYAVRLPVALMPWVLVVLFVPWGRVCASAWPSLKASRTEKSGSAWLWIALFVACLYVTTTSTKPCLAFVPLLPFAALLLAKALLNLSQARSRGFFLLLALGFAVTAVALAALGIPYVLTILNLYIPASLLQILQTAQGLPVMAGVCALGAVLLWKGTRRSLPGGALLVTVLLVTTLIQPVTLILSPSLTGLAGTPPTENTQTGTAAPTSSPYPQGVPTTIEAAPALPDAAILPPPPPAPPVSPVLPAQPVSPLSNAPTQSDPPPTEDSAPTIAPDPVLSPPAGPSDSAGNAAEGATPPPVTPVAPSMAPAAPMTPVTPAVPTPPSQQRQQGSALTPPMAPLAPPSATSPR